ncbi:MAG: hypothetical protein C5B56_07220 [Proteobacteria bacterium]|nr:MAG: hypothetical protein C5B56_07220 [Pseudomonadota bacterium]
MLPSALISSIVLLPAAICLCGASAASAGATQTIANEAGIELSVSDDGSYRVISRNQDWNFAGKVPAPLSRLARNSGSDRAGRYEEIELGSRSSEGAARLGVIRVYRDRPVVVFSWRFLTSGTTAESFPVLSSYPRGLHHLAYTGVFGGYSFDQLGSDGPWVFFDDRANTFILSAASHFMNAALSLGPHEELISGLSASGEDVPRRFEATTALVIEAGVNRAFETWGRFLTDLSGKQRPPNDVDVSLRQLGYWTDNGARYYYSFDEDLGYAGTLRKVLDEFRAMRVRLGYLQLDSWFYPKGHDARWNSADPLHGGTYLYAASKELFPEGLAAFQRSVAVPLIAHNRWIDAHSPYRRQYAMSGNVSVDPRLWDEWMGYLRASGVRTYEQDWLSGPAAPERDLRSGERFLDAISVAARKHNIALQYCMPLPRHFMQGTHYSNLLTIRVSGDRFERSQWPSFLFNGRLASALGEWPWSDVFMSSETSNLLLSVLSGAMVGVGDAIGTFDRANLLRAVRADGVIVKPDEAITPLDQAYIDRAKQRRSPLLASTRTRHERSMTTYLFAFRQADDDPEAAVSPSILGYQGRVYAYDYFNKRGVLVEPGESLSFSVPDDASYWIVAPVGPSGVAVLGDVVRFVSNGRQRVASLRDTGTVTMQLILADGEDRLQLHGFSPAPPRIHAAGASVENLAYDSATRHFQFDLIGRPRSRPVITMRAEPEH